MQIIINSIYNVMIWMIILNTSGCLKLQPKESTYQIWLSHELVDLIGNPSLGIGTRLTSTKLKSTVGTHH